MILPVPLKLDRKFIRGSSLTGLILLLGGAISLALFCWYVINGINEMQYEKSIWERGQPAPLAETQGQYRSRWNILKHYELTVIYQDQQGNEYEKPCEFSTLFGGVDEDQAVEVRYLPDDPERFALSWAIAAEGPRWSNLALYALIILGFGVLLGFAGWGKLGELRLARRLSAGGREIRLQIVEVVRADKEDVQVSRRRRTENPGLFTYRFTYPEHSKKDGHVCSQTIDHVNGIPLFLDDGRRTMTGLMDPDRPDQVLLLRFNFYPFSIPRDQHERLRQMIRETLAPQG